METLNLLNIENLTETTDIQSSTPYKAKTDKQQNNLLKKQEKKQPDGDNLEILTKFKISKERNKFFINSTIATFAVSRKYFFIQFFISIIKQVLHNYLIINLQVRFESFFFQALQLFQNQSKDKNAIITAVIIYCSKFTEHYISFLKNKYHTRFKTTFRKYLAVLCMKQLLNQPQQDILKSKLQIQTIYEDTMEFANIFDELLDNLLYPIIKVLMSMSLLQFNIMSLICYIPLPIAIPYLVNMEQKSKKAFKRTRKEMTNSKFHLTEIQQRQYFIKCYQSVDFEINNLVDQLDNQFNQLFAHQKLRQNRQFIQQLMDNYKSTSKLLVQMHMIFYNNWDIIRCQLFSKQIEFGYDFFKQIATFIGNLGQIQICINNIQQYFNLNQEEVDQNTTIKQIISYLSTSNTQYQVKKHENIQLKCDNVTFGYQSDKLIVKDFSFNFENKLYVLKGPSGCGKTTLFNLLLRIYNVEQGTISIYDLRHRISIVLQQNTILKGKTLAQNIAYDIDVPREKLQEVVAICQISFIGLDDVVGELSGGQMQRIAVARGLARAVDILLLDEATSALDTDTERLLLTALRGYCLQNKLVCLMIAHREACYRYCDEVITMK